MTRSRVLLVVGWYYPDSVGGSEAYVRLLARGLCEAGYDVSIAAAIDGTDEKKYEHDGISVYRYPVPPPVSGGELAGTAPPQLFERFEAHVRGLAPDIVHFHSMTRGCGLFHARLAKSLSRRLFLTVHVPGMTCIRGTMMRWGRVSCDGRMTKLRCAACVAQSRWPFPLALAGIPFLLPNVTIEHEVAREFLSLFDGTVAVAQWVERALIENGVPRSKVLLSRHGLKWQAPVEPLSPSGALRVACLGRITPVKGIDVLIQAFGRTRAPLELRIYGAAVSEEDRRYEARLRHMAGADPRIIFMPPVSPAEVSRVFAAADIVAVPSRWMEAGPYVVLEAFAAGRPVIGTRLGGIAELVHDGIDGLLVAYRVADWAEVLERLAGDRALVSRLQAGVRPVRANADVVSDMLALYTGSA